MILKGYMKTFIYSTIIFISLLPLINYLGYSLHTESNKYGECVGIGEPQDINLKYEMSLKNMLIATILFPSVVAPTMIVTNDFYCPTGIK